MKATKTKRLEMIFPNGKIIKLYFPQVNNFGFRQSGCDLTALAGLTPASVICEIMNEDGSMARLPELLEFAEKHHLKIGTIADLISYRNQHESIIERVAENELNTPAGPFHGIVYRDKPSQSIHLALVKGTITPDEETLVRVHQPVSFVDLIETRFTSHSWNLLESMFGITRTYLSTQTGRWY